MEIDSIVLENGSEYILLATEVIDNIKYFLLINAGDKNDYVIRKEFNSEIVGLSDKKEFEEVVKKFLEHNNIG